MCKFSITFSGDSESLVSRAKQQIERGNGAFNGDTYQGNFNAKTPIGSIEGAYQIAEQEIALTITKKPLLLSCKRIEKKLKAVMR